MTTAPYVVEVTEFKCCCPACGMDVIMTTRAGAKAFVAQHIEECYPDDEGQDE